MLTKEILIVDDYMNVNVLWQLVSTQHLEKRDVQRVHFPLKKNINMLVAIVSLFPPLVLAFAEILPAKWMVFPFCLDTFFYLA